jgi:hypothetical protein
VPRRHLFFFGLDHCPYINSPINYNYLSRYKIIVHILFAISMDYGIHIRCRVSGTSCSDYLEVFSSPHVRARIPLPRRISRLLMQVHETASTHTLSEKLLCFMVVWWNTHFHRFHTHIASDWLVHQPPPRTASGRRMRGPPRCGTHESILEDSRTIPTPCCALSIATRLLRQALWAASSPQALIPDHMSAKANKLNPE